jgi:hypothetical protein
MQPSCPRISLVRRARFTIMTLRQSSRPPNGKVQTHRDRKRRGRWRAKSRACSSFSLTSRGCSQRIRPCRPNRQFRILLRGFTVTARKSANMSPRILATKELPVASRHLWHQGVVHKEFVPAGQIGNSAYYREVLRRLHENVRIRRPEFWQRKNCLLHHDNAPSHTSFFTREFFFTRNIMTVFPHQPYFSLFSVSPIEDKTERPPFWQLR